MVFMDKTIKGHVAGILIQLQNWLRILFFHTALKYWFLSLSQFADSRT